MGTTWAHVARLPVFEHCDRRALRRAAEWGDLVEVAAGEMLLRENRGDYWFFVLVEGRVDLTRAGAGIATVTPGSHFGEAAIVGHRPQPATATAREQSTLFVLGARPLLSLLADSPPLRRALFPSVGPDGYPELVRRAHQQARTEWLALTPPRASALPIRPRPPLVRTGAAGPPAPEPPPPPPPSVPRPQQRRRWRWAAALGSMAVAAATAVTLIVYHPPRIVVSAQRPIDVAGDISIAGTPTHRPTGHYLLLSIHAYRPNLAGFLGAAFRGDPTVSAGAAPVTAADRALATRIGRQQFADSQRDAVASAAAIAGVDARRIRVRFRERNLVGPSAGLVYALAIADMLTGRDLIGGRTVAATGAIEPSGKLDPVGWVGVKASGAAGRASVLLVPAGEQADAFPWVAATYGVADLHEAIAVLQQTGPVKPST